MFAAAKGAPPKGGGIGIWPLLIGVVVLVVVACVVAAVVLMRRRRAAGAPARTGLAASGGSALTGSRAVIDRALCQLASQPVQPPVYAAMIGPDRVSLRLTPPMPMAPPPWQVREEGAVWEAQNREFRNGEQGATGFPLLVSLGTVGGEPTVVNLGRAQGIIALTGDPNASRTLAAAILNEIAASTLTITVVGPMPPTTVPADRMRITEDVRAVVGAARQEPVDPQATGARPPVDWLRQHLIVVTTSVESEAMERLAMRAETSDNTAAVLVIGDVLNAAWRFESSSDGSLDIGVLGLRLDVRQSVHG